MPTEQQCPKCGAVLPADAPDGLCPRCLMTAALMPTRAAGGEPTIHIDPVAEEEPSHRIGRYKILQKLGEGGCGVVYMAEQTEPVRRKVALKVIKLGMDTKQVIARFEAERQALALMDHPNIAKVLDAGATETGRPYFVMELVKGIRITDYCDQNHLSTVERLALFTQVCQAIQHAHQKGIIHRDIKPSNILVTLHDGVPVPKVIDFGIAKATEQPLTERTVFTAFGQFMGTPAYMSPEQAELSGLDIDTRSDIYALGVLLYELLTGRTPFDAKELLQAGLDEMRRRIREEEPVRPSTRLSTMADADLTEVAQQRKAEPAKLPRFIRGDLDWIVMKCLEKDRKRRYETANGLATDLRRHLDNEPVVACPPSRLYRFHKMFRRNKLTFVAVSAVAAALLIGLGLSSFLFLRASREATKSRQVAQFLSSMLEGVGPSVALGRNTTMLREILDKTAERVSKDLKDQPEVAAELLDTVGEVYRALTVLDKAEFTHRQALAIRIRLWGEINAEVATSMDHLAVVLLEATKFTEAEPLFLKALATRKKLLGPEHPAVATSISNLGVLLQYQGKYQDAEILYRQALAMRRKLLGNEHLEVAESLLCVASALWYQHKDLLQAEAMNLEALAIRKKAFGDKHPDVAFCLSNLSTVYDREGKLDEAKAAMLAAIDLWRQMLGDGSAPEAQVLNNLAWLVCRQDKLPDGEVMARRSLEIRRRVLGNKHKDVAESLNMLAVVLQREGKLDEAEKLQREQLDLTIELLTSRHPDVVASKNNLAWLLRGRHKPAEAEELARQALKLYWEVGGTTNADTVQMLMNLGIYCAEQGKVPEAEKAHQEALDHSIVTFGKDSPGVVGPLLLLARFLCDQNRSAEAEKFARRSVVILEGKPVNWGTYNAQALLGRCLVGLTNYVDAEPMLLSACTGMERLQNTLPVDNRMYLEEAVQSLIKLYEAKGPPEKAAEWKKKLTDLNQAKPEKNATPP